MTTGRLSFGSGTFGREVDEETSRQLLDYAIEQGITLLDTAEAYGGGNSKAGRKATYGVDDVREVTTEMYSGEKIIARWMNCLLYTSPSPRDGLLSRMPSSA